MREVALTSLLDFMFNIFYLSSFFYSKEFWKVVLNLFFPVFGDTFGINNLDYFGVAECVEEETYL